MGLTFSGVLRQATGAFSIADAPPSGGQDLSSLPNNSKVMMILSGQSNWRGHPLDSPYSGTMATKTQVWLPGGWELYTPNHHPEYETPMSPTLGMVLEFEQRYPGLTLYIVETGQGGQGFTAGSGVFGPNGAIRAKLISYITDAIANLKAAGGDFYCMGFSFFQGEKDSEQTTWANAYQAQLSNFLDALDAAAGIDLYKLITRIHVNVPQPAESAKVRAAHVALADSIIDTDVYSTLGDNLHFTPNTYRLIGESYLDRLEALPPTPIDADTVVDPGGGGTTTPPTPPSAPVAVSFKNLVRMTENPTGSIHDNTPYGGGSLPKGATVDATFVQGDYLSFKAVNMGNSTSVIVMFTTTEDAEYDGNDPVNKIAGFNFKTNIVHTHPPMGSGDAQTPVHKGNGVVGRIAWIGADVVCQTSDDDGATWNRTHKTFSGVMSGRGSCFAKVIQGFSGSVEKRLDDFKKGRVS